MAAPEQHGVERELAADIDKQGGLDRLFANAAAAAEDGA